MDHSQDHRIHLILDNKEYGIRHWSNVPRRGDFIMLKRTKADTFFTAKITRVTWGVAVDDISTRWPTVNIHCTEEK